MNATCSPGLDTGSPSLVFACKLDRYRANFVICQSCYWCASHFAGDIHRCPSCKADSIDALPIFARESYRVGFWKNGNVEISFGKDGETITTAAATTTGVQ